MTITTMAALPMVEATDGRSVEVLLGLFVGLKEGDVDGTYTC